MLHFIKLKNRIPVNLYFLIVLALCAVQQVYSIPGDCSTDGSQACKTTVNGEDTAVGAGVYCFVPDGPKKLLYISAGGLDSGTCTSNASKYVVLDKSNNKAPTSGTTTEFLVYNCGTDDCATSSGYVVLDKSSNEAATGSTTDFVIYNCGANGCTLYVSAYYLDTGNVLYKYETDKWTKIASSFTVGYYLSGALTSGKYPSLINVDHDTSPTYPSVTINAGYYPSGDATSFKLIKCTNDNGVKTCQGDTSTASFTSTKYYMDAVGAASNKIITCTTAGCTSGEALKAYYVNAGKTGSVIKCDGSKCEEVDVTATACKNPGDLIKPSGNTLYLCNSASAKGPSLSPSSDAFVSFEKGTAFPGAPSADFTVKISKEGVTFLLEDTTIQACTATAAASGDCFTGNTDGQHCIISSSGLVLKYATTGASCANAVDAEGPLYLDKDYKAVTVSDVNKAQTVSYVYDCDDSSKCKVAKGYPVIANGYYIKCSGWKGDLCVGAATASGNTCSSSLKDGTLAGAGKHLCFGTSTGYALPASGSTATIAFQLKDISANYGMKKDDIVVLSVSDTEAVVTELEGETVRYFINQNFVKDKRIIKCTGNECETDPGKVGFYLDSGAVDSTSGEIIGLIQCTEKDTEACTAIGTAIPNGYFVDALTGTKNEDGKTYTYTGLINCDGSTKCTSVDSPPDGIYLNGFVVATSATKMFTKALIKCADSKCTEITLNATKDANSIYLSGTDVIRCVSDTDGCSVFDLTTSGVATAPTDLIPLYFVNAEKEKSIIECTSDNPATCTAIEASDGDVFLNGNLKDTTKNQKGVDDQLIICDSTGCKTVKKDFSASADQSKVEFFLNAGKYNSGSADVPLIKCLYAASATGCAAASGVEGGFFINGSYGDSGKNYLIKCTSATECGYYEEAEGVIGKAEYYLNGSKTSQTDGVIKCTIAASKNKRDETATTTPVKGTCEIITTAANKVYINSDCEAGKLIQCSPDCAVIPGTGEDESKTFYPNGDAPASPTSYKDLVIECGSEKCTIVDGKEHNVYINANYVATDNEKPLIICKAKKCEEVEATASAFYANAGKESADDYSELIITCTSTTTAACSFAEDVAKDNIYINGNSANDATNKIIVCTGGSCNPSEVTFATGETKKYFVNSGIGSTAPLTSAVIECTSESCGPITPSLTTPVTVTEIIYVNGNYDVDGTNYLIKCISDGCTPYASEDFTNGEITTNTKEHYINGAVTSGITDAVIEVSFEVAKSKKREVENKTETTNYKAKIELKTPAAGYMYINSFNKNLIQCSSTACASNSALVGDSSTPTYFVNGDPSTEAANFVDKLIQCSGEENCIPFNGKENGVYINGNFLVSSTNAGESGKRLIICSAKKCQSVADGNNVAYFVNAASQEDLSDALINCSSTAADPCTIAEGNPNDIYLNGNFKVASTSFTDDANYLIICGEDKCQAEVGKTKTGNSYYANASQTGLTDSLIKCSTEKCELINLSSIITGSVTELFYVNGNYGEGKDIVNYIIKCESTTPGCTATGTESPANMEHYVNGDSTGFEDAVIEVTFNSNEENKNEKRENIAATCKFAENVDVGSIFINSSPTTKLIQCYTKGQKNVCEAYAGGGSDDIPFYYVNGANNKLLIECITDECSEIEVEENDIFINSNLKGTSNTNGIENVPLIICTNDGCIPSNSNLEEDGDEYYINSGKYIDSGTTKALIKCTKSGTTITCIGEKAGEQYIYINGNNNNQIIICSSEEECEVVDTAPTDLKSEYYINSVDTTKKSIILCSKAEGCQIIKEDLVDKVFINANYGEEYDNENQIISCPKGECILVKNEATEIPEYYINGDTTNTEYLKGDLIKCVKKDNKVTCVEEDAGKSDIYINANFDQSKKQIIVCKGVDEDPEDSVDEGSCMEVNVVVSDKTKYYVNAGSDKNSENKLMDTLIKCTDSNDPCQVSDGVEESDVYIDANTEQLIYCSKEKGCKAVESQANKDKNEFYLNANDDKADLQNDLIKCQLDVETNEKKCIEIGSKPNYVYIDSYTIGNIIYCTSSSGCISKPAFSEEKEEEEEEEEKEEKPVLPKFYVNGDDIDFKDNVDKDPLNGDLIKCTKTGTKDESKISCTIIKAENDYVYINSNYDKEDGDPVNQLIICTEEEGCLAKPCSSSNSSSGIEKREENGELSETSETTDTSEEKFPKYYINSGNSNKLENGIIECIAADEACVTKTAEANQVYKNSNDHDSKKPIIKCGNNVCRTSESSATKDNNEYFKNAGSGSETPLEYDIIECSNDGKSTICTELKEVNEGVYLNSNFVESGDNEQLIQCFKDNGCVGLRSESTSREGEYYINAEASSITNAIILCINKKCEKQTPASIPIFYVGYMKDDIDGLIQCTDKNKACEFKSSVPFNGYYLNGGYNKAQNQTILCDTSDGCITLNVDLGYYVNAGDTSNPVIKCEKEGVECVAGESPKCPESKDAVPGNYCYENNQLKFYPSTNSTSISASRSENIYTFATILDGGFPGIKRETGSLFKISQYYINRFYQSGIVMIDKNGKLIDSLTSDQSDVSLYDCNDSTKICTERPGCTSNTYMYDSENKKAVFCNNGKLEYADVQGYVVDGSRVIGSNHPYVIHCESNKKCKSIRPKATSYYENNGYDSSSNALIQCTNNNCVTVTAEAGYYVGHDGQGIIQCTSNTSCVFISVKNKVKYVNAGSDKTSNAIIECSKSNGCSSTKAKIGYYLTYTSTLLIQCTSSSNCVEFTPTVNYYDNADSSEGNNTIINCEQSSQVINCSIEQTNSGFYMSSIPNVLIRCKSGSKCRTITVKNGIFRGALKGLTGGSKRTDEQEVVESVEREVEDVELEKGNKMSIAMPRDSDDAYGIIRCIAGKCSALSPSEVASIPVCEFNNNKCYITLEYAMTKSATTSISAGNICTNADRSVFYFATDTIVVKPNVISGVTATYVFTTTNSNCLEVNDSYTDMFFTVGSNIYLLDQGSVLQFYESGYYFINTAKNTLVNGNDIDAYNDESVKLYKCNGSSCSISNKPNSLTYYADVNKRILKYNINSDAYSFAYPKDITCIFANNKCTPNADLKNQEFCITYKGELVLAKQDIKNRETGECYKATSITNTIYGYSQYLYNMNVNSAQMVDETGYYIVNLSTNTTVVSKNYKTKNNNLVLYGCQFSSCKEYTPDENTYYYDSRAKTILKYHDGVWSTPDTSGYAYISIDPTNTYIYKFTKKLDEIKINSIANYGYYYTVDGEMYHCNQDENGDCVPISNTGYYFTNAGEVFYCVHDSEELEPTECVKQACVSGQYYYINDAYYRCEVSSLLVPVMSRYCSYNENVIVNFPLALTDEYPEKIKQAIEGIEKNNNSTAVVTLRGKNYLKSVTGIFTNCTYNVEETKSSFDLVCVNNFVSVDQETDEVKICSMEQLGYVECIEDEENPEKCNVSGSFARLSLSIMSVVVATLLSVLLMNRN